MTRLVIFERREKNSLSSAAGATRRGSLILHYRLRPHRTLGADASLRARRGLISSPLQGM